MTITSGTHIGEIVRLNFKTAPIFHEIDIDYCCGGSKTISEACDEAGIEPEQLIARIEKIIHTHDPDSEYINNLSPDELCEYIHRRHHAYVKRSIPFLKESLKKICGAHGAIHPELLKIKRLFETAAGELIMHMHKEEIMLFPYIRKMVKAKKEGSPMVRPAFGSVANPIAMMILQHETEGKRFRKIAQVSGNYDIPDDACATYESTMYHLKEFERDLYRHIHLENNVLFPAVVEMEAELKN